MEGTISLIPFFFLKNQPKLEKPEVFLSKPVKAADSGNPLLFLQPRNVLMEERPNTQSQRCAFWHGSSFINEMPT